MADRSQGHQLTDQRGEAAQVELLYFADCPNHAMYLPQLRQLLAQLSRPTVLVEREIADEETAVREQFLGSPTVRVNGVDVDPGAWHRTSYGLQCRLYRTSDGLTGVPPDEWVRTALSRWWAQR